MEGRGDDRAQLAKSLAKKAVELKTKLGAKYVVVFTAFEDAIEVAGSFEINSSLTPTSKSMLDALALQVESLHRFSAPSARDLPERERRNAPNEDENTEADEGT